MRLSRKSVALLFLIGLPLHTFLMMVLYGTLRIPSNVIGILSTWKESLIAFVTLLIVYSSISKSPIRFVRLTTTDCLILLFSLWLGIRLIWSYAVGSNLPLNATVYGLRFYLLPVALYAIGRLAPLKNHRLQQVFWGLVIVGALTGGLAIIEWLLPNNIFIGFIQSLGYQSYFSDYVNKGALHGPGQTAESMWLSLGGDSFVRRAGSIYMISKPFAFTYLLIIPITLAFLWARPMAKSPKRVRMFLLLSWLGLTLSFTRAAIVVCVLVSICMALHFKKSKLAFSVSTFILIVGLFGLALPSVQSYIGRILQAEDSSTRQHLDGWINGLTSSADQFMIGFGIGTANQELARFDLGDSVTLASSVSESLYVQTFQELGVVGLLLYLAILLSILDRSNKMVKAKEYEQRFLGISLFWITIACTLISVAAILSQGSFLVTYAFWFLCGQANIKAAAQPSFTRDRVPQYAYRN